MYMLVEKVKTLSVFYPSPPKITTSRYVRVNANVVVTFLFLSRSVLVTCGISRWEGVELPLAGFYSSTWLTTFIVSNLFKNVIAAKCKGP